MRNPLKKTCPNCESAWTGGHPNPEEITFCVLCGEGPPMWMWRLPRFIRNKITRRRFAQAREMIRKGEL